MEGKTSEKAASSSSGANFDPVELFDSGGIFYLEDLPINSEFGIDYESWRIGEKFRGVKMIPPGVHFIYYSVADKYGQLGMRSGFFHEFALGEALVMRWNRADECVVSKQLTPEQMENFQRRRRELDPSLGSYPFDHYKRWISLTNHVSPALIKALTPKSGVITSETSLIGKTFKKGQHHDDKKKEDESMSKISSTSTSINDAEMESKKFNIDCLKSAPTSLKEAEKDLPVMKHDETCEINFTKMPTQSYPIGSSSIDITKHSIDLSYKLDLFVKDQHKNMLTNNEDESANIDNLLGELQFAFVCFLVGNVYDGFEQWKSILNLVCNCEKAIELYPGFYLKLVNALYYQLGEMPLDFFTDITTSNNFLVVHLHNLFENIKESSSNDSNEKLKRRCDQFKNYLQQKYNFDFEEEPDEYAPVICEEAEI